MKVQRLEKNLNIRCILGELEGERIAEGLLMKGLLCPADEFIFCLKAMAATKGF